MNLRISLMYDKKKNKSKIFDTVLAKEYSAMSTYLCVSMKDFILPTQFIIIFDEIRS